MLKIIRKETNQFTQTNQVFLANPLEYIICFITHKSKKYVAIFYYTTHRLFQFLWVLFSKQTILLA